MEERIYQGHVYRRAGPTEPWTLAGPAQQPQGGPQPFTIGQPDLYKAKSDARDEARLGLSQKAEGRQAANQAETLRQQRERFIADLALKGYRLGANGEPERIPGWTPPLTTASAPKISAKERADAIAGYNSANSLDRIVADLEQKFKAGPGATQGLAGLTDYLPLTANQQFDAAGNAARGIVGQALGFTGGQLNTATEAQQSVGPYLPQASDRDATILDKINRLKQLAGDARKRSAAILGGIPDANGNITPISADNHGEVAGALTSSTKPDGKFSNASGVALAKKLSDAYTRGAGLDQLNQILRENGYEPYSDQHAIEAIQRGGRLNFLPPETGDPRSGAAKAAAPVTTGAAGAYGLSATNALTGGYLDEMVGGNTQMAKDFANEQHPLASMAGGITGSTMAMLPIGRGVQALARSGPVAAALLGTGARGAAAGDALYGAAYGSGESNEDRITGALMGAGAAGAGNLVGGKISKALGAAVRGVSDPAVQYLTQRGVPLTIGQTLGNQGMVGRTVNKLESIPVVGDLIGARRRDGVEAFNREAIRDALEPIGATIQGEAGQTAVGRAQDAVSQAYTDALQGVSVPIDAPFVNELSGAMARGRAVPVQGEQFGHLMDAKFHPLFGANQTLDGPAVQAAMQTVRGAGSQFGKEGAMGSMVADELGNIDTSIADLLARQSPGTGEALGQANQAYANLAPINDASISAVNSGMGAGVFTPAQLNRSVANNTRRYGGRAAAASGDRQTDLMRYGQEVLPSSIPNSGTVDRLAALALPAALGGGAYSMQDVSPEGAIALALLAGGSTRTGTRLIQKSLVSRPDVAKQIGELLIDRSKLGGAALAPLAIDQVVR